jgi:hypothetical protein
MWRLLLEKIRFAEACFAFSMPCRIAQPGFGEVLQPNASGIAVLSLPKNSRKDADLLRRLPAQRGFPAQPD